MAFSTVVTFPSCPSLAKLLFKGSCGYDPFFTVALIVVRFCIAHDCCIDKHSNPMGDAITTVFSDPFRDRGTLSSLLTSPSVGLQRTEGSSPTEFFNSHSTRIT
jgi:hypothetical protein